MKGVQRNWEGRSANKTNENRSVRTGQGELANRRRMLANAADRSELLASMRNAPNNGRLGKSEILAK